MFQLSGLYCRLKSPFEGPLRPLWKAFLGALSCAHLQVAPPALQSQCGSSLATLERYSKGPTIGVNVMDSSAILRMDMGFCVSILIV